MVDVIFCVVFLYLFSVLIKVFLKKVLVILLLRIICLKLLDIRLVVLFNLVIKLGNGLIIWLNFFVCIIEEFIVWVKLYMVCFSWVLDVLILVVIFDVFLRILCFFLVDSLFVFCKVRILV